MSHPGGNPGGEHRWSVRVALKNHVDAQNVPGLVELYPVLSPARDWDEAMVDDLGCMALAFIHMPNDAESRAASVGPDNPGGKDITYDVELRVMHLQSDDSLTGWTDGQRSYDRLIDRLKDCLRGEGRDLGRPDIIFQAADWPRDGGIVHKTDEPQHDEESGFTYRNGSLFFVISQYLPTYVP